MCFRTQPRKPQEATNKAGDYPESPRRYESHGCGSVGGDMNGLLCRAFRRKAVKCAQASGLRPRLQYFLPRLLSSELPGI